MKDRIVFADYLRIIACFMVMLVHASENFYGADTSGLASNMSMLANEANRFWVAFYDGFVARTCVPLFMMLSAFLLVPMKDGETMTSFYKKRFTRILPPIAFFFILYCTLPMAWGAMTPQDSLSDLKLIAWNFPSMAGHLWFVYPLISLYLFIPVISPWIAKASAKEERIFLALWFVSTFIPYIQRFITPEVWGECFWNKFSMLWYFSGFLGYLVLAHYIRTHLDWKRSTKLIVGAICFLAGSAFTMWGYWHKAVPMVPIETPTLEWAWEFCTPNLAMSTFGIFLIFSCIEAKTAPAWVTTLSKLTFGMYLMHMFYLIHIADFFRGADVANPTIPVWAAIPAIAICTFICCALTAKLISLVKGSKWIIGA